MMTPAMFGDEVMTHPQPKRHGQKNEQQPSPKILEECAKTLAARLGDGMEDVSFREFVDLVLAFSGKQMMVRLVERDTAPSNRESSVLRTIYFSSLKALHRIKDPPTKEDPPATSFETNESITFPDDENDETFCPPPQMPSKNFSNCSLPMESHSRTSTTSASSWSSVSAPGIPDQTIPDVSFHFVSQFDDDDDDESLNDSHLESAFRAGEYDDCYSNSADDKSMAVYFEKRGRETAKSNVQHRIELPHDFEVVTIVDMPESGQSPFNRSRTYSITTTTSVSSKGSRQKRFLNSWSSRSQTAAAVDAATKVTTVDVEEANEKPVCVKEGGRSRSDGTITTLSSTLSGTVRKMMSLHSKSTRYTKVEI